MPENNCQIRITDWATDKDKLKKIRQQVFIKEQNVPVEMEWDEFDDRSTHFLVTVNDRTIACARLKPDGQIGRMAVLKEYRNLGIGNTLLQCVLRVATEQKLEAVYLHAQESAIPFYEKQGFTAAGEIFYEANIPHREMSRKTC